VQCSCVVVQLQVQCDQTVVHSYIWHTAQASQEATHGTRIPCHKKGFRKPLVAPHGVSLLSFTPPVALLPLSQDEIVLLSLHTYLLLYASLYFYCLLPSCPLAAIVTG
jgi:hypothetical protein